MPSLRPSLQKTLDNCSVVDVPPSPPVQAEFARQLALLVEQQKSFPSIVTWVRLCVSV